MQRRTSRNRKPETKRAQRNRRRTTKGNLPPTIRPRTRNKQEKDRDAAKDRNESGGSGKAPKQLPDGKTAQRRGGSQSPQRPSAALRLPQVSLPVGVTPLVALLKCLFYLALAMVAVYWLWKNRAAIGPAS